jgi:hypothetical protein
MVLPPKPAGCVNVQAQLAGWKSGIERQFIASATCNPAPCCSPQLKIASLQEMGYSSPPFFSWALFPGLRTKRLIAWPSTMRRASALMISPVEPLADGFSYCRPLEEN